MLTFLDEFPDHISDLLRSSRNISILGYFNIPWNISEHPDTTSMQETMDMHICMTLNNIYTYKCTNLVIPLIGS